VEFNCRFGDPETQAVLPLLKGDFLELLNSCAQGKINKQAVEYSGGASVCVVAALKGYPDSYESGFELTGLTEIEDPQIISFQARCKYTNGILMTQGGKVLCVTCEFDENNRHLAKQKSYNALKTIRFEGSYYRKDIADNAIN